MQNNTRMGIAALAAALCIPGATSGAQTAPNVSGTYRLAICKVAPCTPDDTLRRVVWGTLVLGDTLFTVTEAADPANSNRLRNTRVNGPRNACWVMTRRDRHAQTYAAAGGLGTTSWSSTGGGNPTIALTLFRTADAGHTMTATFTNGTLLGAGRSSGSGVLPGWGRDTIVAVRSGPPDYSICLAAAAVPLPTPQGIVGLRSVVTSMPPRADTAARVVIVLRDGITSSSPPPLAPARYRAGGLWDPGSIVYMPARPDEVSAAAFSDSILVAVRTLRAAGMPANRITIVGGSDGAVMAATISVRLNEGIGYVLLDGCTRAMRAAVTGGLHGDVLSFTGNGVLADPTCASVFGASPAIGIHTEVHLNQTMPIFSNPTPSTDWTDLISDWIQARKLGPPWR